MHVIRSTCDRVWTAAGVIRLKFQAVFAVWAQATSSRGPPSRSFIRMEVCQICNEYLVQGEGGEPIGVLKCAHSVHPSCLGAYKKQVSKLHVKHLERVVCPTCTAEREAVRARGADHAFHMLHVQL